MDAIEAMPFIEHRRGAISLWRQIADAMAKDIRAGKYAPGEQIPTEFELATIFNVHRNTVRRALQVLRNQSLIRIEQGRGSYVQERVVRYLLGAKTHLTVTLRDVERVSECRVIGMARLRADSLLASDLRIPKNQFLQRVDTVRLVDGAPVCISSSYFPLPRFEGIEKFILETGSFTESWLHYGIEESRIYESRITAAPLSGAYADILGQHRGRPVIVLVNIDVDAEGTPIGASHTRVSPQHMELIVRYGF
jgi:GntR family phosphonate transport system transcriptional regulator